MSRDLIERLREHAAGLSVDRGLRREDTDALEPPSQLEADLLLASNKLDTLMSTASPSEVIVRELAATQQLLASAVNELQKYRQWAQQIKLALGAFPGGEL